jgi:acetylglutamate kinase
MHMAHKLASGDRPLVVKYGGNGMGADPDALDPVLDELAGLQRAGRAVVLVHGGGPDIDRALLRQGVRTSRIAGLRVTDAATLEVTEAVLCATLNKRLVRGLTRSGSRVAGVSGQDGGTLVATKTQASDGSDLGFVGTVIETDPALLFALLHAGFLPVVAPLALSNGATHAYNVNADAAAAAIAGALDASALVMLTGVPRVLRDPSDPLSSIHRLSLHDAIAFVDGPACRDGMRPKLNAAITYVSARTGSAYICATKPGAIAAALDGDATIVANTF